MDWKNVSGLVQAYSQLPDEVRSEYACVIVGDGEEYSAIRSLAKDVTGVHLVGALPFEQAMEVQSFFTIHVHPSMP